VAVVHAGFGRNVATAAAASTAAVGLNPGLRLHLAGPEAPVDARIAAAASWAFGRRLRELRDAGVREAHLFIAAPAALALLFGRAINAGPSMTLYHVEDGTYTADLRLAA
jgi:hypothetical protein